MADRITFNFMSSELDGPEYWDAVRELQRHGPLSWAENDGGFWIATGHEVVLRMAQDWETFSSGQGVALTRPSPEELPYIMPIDIDPPRQRAYRRQLNPHFSPKALNPLTDRIREVADELIDPFAAAGKCDIAVDFARKFPGTVFFRLVVSCTDEDFRIAEPSSRAISFETGDPQKFVQAAADLRAWAAKVLASREGMAAHDAVAAVQNLRQTGLPFADHELLSGLQILAQGGIGTSASTIGVIVKVLAENPELQARVRTDRSLIPALIEECVRMEPAVPLMFRTITRDVEVAGRQLKKGQKVGLLFAAANRDPAIFDHPDEVDIDRPHNRHLAFGAGTHRCLGSNLARLQIRVAMETLLERLGPWRIPEGATIKYLSRQARGPISIPLEFEPAAVSEAS